MEESPPTRRNSAQYGDLIGGTYYVQRVIGEGGVGVVFEAQHKDDGQRVAIKIAHLAEGEAFAAFQRNARAMAELQSPHTVRVVEVGETVAGLPWCAMEYLRGEDLGAMLADRGPLSIDDALRWTTEVCESLAEAHDVGLVHRAIKPRNVFLAALDGASSIHVLDYGLSLVPPLGAPKVASPVSLAEPMTQRLGAEADSETGLVARTLDRPTRPSEYGPHVLEAYHFLAPEQVRGSEVDARTDVWGVGAFLFRLLTGSSPFIGSTPDEVSESILGDSPIELRDLRAEVPSGLDAVVKQCLRRAPRNRFQSMESLAIALRGARAEARETPRVMVAMGPTVGGAGMEEDAPLTPLVPPAAIESSAFPTPVEPPAGWRAPPLQPPLLRQPPSILQQIIADGPPILNLAAKANRGEAPRAPMAFHRDGAMPAPMAAPMAAPMPPPMPVPMPPPSAPARTPAPPPNFAEATKTVVKITEAPPLAMTPPEPVHGPDTVQDMPAVPPAARSNRVSPDFFGLAPPVRPEPVHRAEINWRPSAPVSAPISIVQFAPDAGQPPPYALRPQSSRAASLSFGLVLVALALGSVGLLYSSSLRWPIWPSRGSSSAAATSSSAPANARGAPSSSQASVPTTPSAAPIASASVSASPSASAPPPVSAAPPPSSAPAAVEPPPPAPPPPPPPATTTEKPRPPPPPVTTQRPPPPPPVAPPPATTRRVRPPAPPPGGDPDAPPSILDKRK